MLRQLVRFCTKNYYKYHSARNRLSRKKMGPNIKRLVPTNSAQWYMCVDEAVDYLLRGQVVAIPTDTLYGLVTLAENADKLYRIKNRSTEKPLGLFLNQPEQIKKYCVQTVPDEMLKILYPGPVTLLFERSSKLRDDFNPGVSSVGFRIPQARFARDLARTMPFRLLAQTSANVSGSDRNPICIQDFEELWDEIDLIIDGGSILENNGSRLGSTVVDLSISGQFKLIRAGCAPIETLQLMVQFGLRPADDVTRRLLEVTTKREEHPATTLLEVEVIEREEDDGNDDKQDEQGKEEEEEGAQQQKQERRHQKKEMAK